MLQHRRSQASQIGKHYDKDKCSTFVPQAYASGDGSGDGRVRGAAFRTGSGRCGVRGVPRAGSSRFGGNRGDAHRVGVVRVASVSGWRAAHDSAGWYAERVVRADEYQTTNRVWQKRRLAIAADATREQAETEIERLVRTDGMKD